jgi:hypothetical protein
MTFVQGGDAGLRNGAAAIPREASLTAASHSASSWSQDLEHSDPGFLMAYRVLSTPDPNSSRAMRPGRRR